MRHLLMAHQQESFLPFSSWQSLSCCLSRVAKRSTPKPRGPLPFPSEPHGPLLTSPKLPDPGPLSFPSEPRGTLLFYFRTTWTSIYLLAPEPCGSPIYFRAAWSTPSLLQSRMVYSLFTLEPRGLLFSPPKPCGPPHFLWSRVVSSFLPQNLVVLPSMAAAPRFKSQCPSSFAAPFPTPPTVSYTCQHPCILPALLGCHSKSGQVWPHGTEPIISKLTHRPCNQGELLPSPPSVEVTPMSLVQSRATAI